MKSADDIAQHYKASSKATFIEGKSADELKKGIQERLSKKMLDIQSKEMDNLVRYYSGTGMDTPNPTPYYPNAVRNLIQQWAGTSGDTNAKSIMMQLAAKAEFKLEGSTIWWKKEALKEAEELFKTHGKAAGQFLRLMYEDTQEHLKKLGLKTVRVVRGHTGIIGDTLSTIKNPLYKTEIQLQPMSSFSSDLAIATDFADIDPSTRAYSRASLFFAEIPAERILSTPVTGFGCMEEVEYVVLGSLKKAESVLASTLRVGESWDTSFLNLTEASKIIHKVTKDKVIKKVGVAKDLFIPAKTIKEAEAWALENIQGLKKVSFKNFEINSVNSVLNELHLLQSKYGKLGGMEEIKIVPKSVKFAARMNMGKTLEIRSDMLDSYFDRLVGAGINKSKKGLAGLVDHEIGHALTPAIFKGRGVMTDFGKRLEIFFEKNKERIIKEISPYAGTARHEFVAEAFALREEGVAPKWALDWLKGEGI
jgi:hypothetical protein